MGKILLVSSLQAFLERNRGLLNRANFHIVTAGTGMEALRIHREQRVDLIVAELEMSDMGGDNLCSLVRREKDYGDVSIILICRDTPEHLERVRQSGANDWIVKPVQPEQLLETIGKLLNVATRKGHRVLLRTQVQGSRISVPFFCISHNISASGLLIESSRHLDQGERINCIFSLPGTRQIVADGETVRSERRADGVYLYGIRFIDLAPESRSEIEKFIATNARLQSNSDTSFLSAVPPS
ncbi:MAG TPA: response regulator [Geobacteraceae bacterium]|nr:response regulator [Geobacteraceae bacterium]